MDKKIVVLDRTLKLSPRGIAKCMNKFNEHETDSSHLWTGPGVSGARIWGEGALLEAVGPFRRASGKFSASAPSMEKHPGIGRNRP